MQVLRRFTTRSGFCSPPNLVNSQPQARTHIHFELGACRGLLSREYLGTARTLLLVARNMTVETISERLRAFAEAYDRRTERALLADAAG